MPGSLGPSDGESGAVGTRGYPSGDVVRAADPRTDRGALDAAPDSPLGLWRGGDAGRWTAALEALGAAVDRASLAREALRGDGVPASTWGAVSSSLYDLQSIICAPEYRWPSCAWALAVVDCESSFRTWVVNPAGPYVGLWQVDIAHGYTIEQLQDPVFNTQAAWKLYQSGTRHWPNCP